MRQDQKVVENKTSPKFSLNQVALVADLAVKKIVKAQITKKHECGQCSRLKKRFLKIKRIVDSSRLRNIRDRIHSANPLSKGFGRESSKRNYELTKRKMKVRLQNSLS